MQVAIHEVVHHEEGTLRCSEPEQQQMKMLRVGRNEGIFDEVGYGFAAMKVFVAAKRIANHNGLE